MTDQPGSARFQALLESALQEYEKKPGVVLADWKDSLAIQLQRCHSLDDITTLLRDKMQAFNDNRQRDRIFKSIKATVSILTPVSAIASIAGDAGLVWQKVLACPAFLTIFAELTPTWESDTFYSWHPTGRMYHSQVHIYCRYPSDVQINQAANGMITSCDALAEMLESIEHFIRRLRIYAETPHPMPEVDEIVVKLMVELVSTLALVTRKLKNRRLRESFLAIMLLYSARCSQMGKEFFRGQRYQQSTSEA